jgi:PII-like signaling protein
VKLEGQGLLVRIYIGESDRWNGRPLYQQIVELLRKRGIAGATVLRGIEGFGAKAHLHTTRILRLSEDLPVLIEVVEQEERLRAILPELDAMVADGLITLERVEVIAYRAGPAQGKE